MAVSESNWFEVQTSKLSGIKRNDENQILTDSFLSAFEGHTNQIYSVLFGGKGILSNQLSKDMAMNLKKIREKYLANPQEYETLEKLVAFEKDQFGKEKLQYKEDVAMKGLLWFNRTLNFLLSIVEGLAERNGKEPSSVGVDAYKKTIRQYHGWVGRNTVTTALKFLANMDKLLKNFNFTEEEFQVAAKKLSVELRPYIEENIVLFKKYDLDFDHKVL